MNPNPRRVAARVVQQVVEDNAWSNVALDAALRSTPLAGPDRGLCTQLVYGTLTWLRTIDAVLEANVKGKLTRVEPQVACILRVAVYQLGWLDRVPDHAAVDQAVRHARKVRGRAAGFVNGVLRSTLRGRETWPEIGGAFRAGDNPHTLARRWSLPDWLAQRWASQFGVEGAFSLAEAISLAPPVCLRARGPEGRDLGSAGLLAPDAIRPEKWSRQVEEAIAGGLVAVQDEAAQLVSHLAGAAPGERVLDACAGQGGKSLHLADAMGDTGEVVAADPVQERLERIPAHDRIQPLHGDLRQLSKGALAERTFDVVLIDAPCSGLGVLRRHPEGRWTRRDSDPATQAALQAELLDAALPLLAPGGRLVYAVCTTTPEEGPRQIEALLNRAPNLRLDLESGDPRVPWDRLRRDSHGFVTLPHEHDCDGFFMTRLRSQPER